jgi:2-phospho-L-lactate guanylyltransferase (CobY/MobA/RfbA family)
LFPLRFGNDSFLPHLADAKVTGQPWVVLSFAGIGLDVDTPDDLYQLALAPGNKRSQLLARNFLELGARSNIDTVSIGTAKS